LRSYIRANRNIGKLITNFISLAQSDLSSRGAVLDLTVSCTNHSCDPNATLIMEGRKLNFRALKSILKGEEIFISYVDTSYPCYHRQKELQDDYFFKCVCPVCQQGVAAVTDYFLHPFNEAAKTFRESAQEYLTDHSDLPEQKRYSDTSSGFLVAAEMKASSELHEARMSKPSKQVHLLENLCRTLHDSRIWPIYRQPYAEARLDLIEALISQGQTVPAITHLAKLYFADTIQYSPHHPKRVVSVVLFFKLLLHECMSQESPTTLPFDVTAVLVAIGKDAVINAEKSHGKESSLTVNVMLRFREVLSEVDSKDRGALEESRRQRALQDLKAFADRLQL
jgi:SET domain